MEKRERAALFPGSFDPLTLGHLDMIRRGAALFDRLTVAVLVNLGKKALFSPEERVKMVQSVTKDLPNVEVITFSGLLVDCCRQQGVYTLLRGLRGVSDFEYEMQLSQGYRKIEERIDSLFLMTDPAHSYISSSIVRDLAAMGGDFSAYVPEELIPLIQEKIATRQG